MISLPTSSKVLRSLSDSLDFFQQAEKVTVVYPMRFQDSTDIVLATSFLQVRWNIPFFD